MSSRTTWDADMVKQVVYWALLIKQKRKRGSYLREIKHRSAEQTDVDGGGPVEDSPHVAEPSSSRTTFRRKK